MSVIADSLRVIILPNPLAFRWFKLQQAQLATHLQTHPTPVPACSHPRSRRVDQQTSNLPSREKERRTINAAAYRRHYRP